MRIKEFCSLAFLVMVPLALGHGVSDREAGWVRLPLTYTAMKGDIVVSFDLMNSSQVSWPYCKVVVVEDPSLNVSIILL